MSEDLNVINQRLANIAHSLRTVAGLIKDVSSAVTEESKKLEATVNRIANAVQKVQNVRSKSVSLTQDGFDIGLGSSKSSGPFKGLFGDRLNRLYTRHVLGDPMVDLLKRQAAARTNPAALKALIEAQTFGGKRFRVDDDGEVYGWSGRSKNFGTKRKPKFFDMWSSTGLSPSQFLTKAYGSDNLDKMLNINKMTLGSSPQARTWQTLGSLYGMLGKLHPYLMIAKKAFELLTIAVVAFIAAVVKVGQMMLANSQVAHLSRGFGTSSAAMGIGAMLGKSPANVAEDFNRFGSPQVGLNFIDLLRRQDPNAAYYTASSLGMQDYLPLKDLSEKDFGRLKEEFGALAEASKMVNGTFMKLRLYFEIFTQRMAFWFAKIVNMLSPLWDSLYEFYRLMEIQIVPLLMMLAGALAVATGWLNVLAAIFRWLRNTFTGAKQEVDGFKEAVKGASRAVEGTYGSSKNFGNFGADTRINAWLVAYPEPVIMP